LPASSDFPSSSSRETTNCKVTLSGTSGDGLAHVSWHEGHRISICGVEERFANACGSITHPISGQMKLAPNNSRA
jgi:hypothetical protein